MLHLIESTFSWILHASLYAAILIALLALLRLLIRSKLPPACWCALWLLAGLRFVSPPAFTIFAPTRFTSPSASMTAPIQASANVITRITLFPPPTPPSAPPQAPRLSYRHVALAWLTITALLLIRRCITLLNLARHLRRLPRVTDPAILRIVRTAAADLKIRQRITVLQTDTIRTPALAGVFRPTLLLPSAFANTASAQDLRLVILHELIHIKRHDVLIDRLIGIVRDLHFFNPIGWLWTRLYAADRELACDRAVLRRVHAAERDTYAQCLLNMIQRLAPLATAPLPATIGIFHPKANLKRRLTMISTFTDSRGRGRGRLVASLVAVLAVGCAALTGPFQSATSSTEPNTSPDASAPHQPVEARVPTVSVQDQALAVALDKKTLELNFDATPFSDVVNYLRDVTDTNIYVNWGALEAAGIDRNTPVTARLRDIRFRKALDVVLADVGGGNVKLGYVAADGVITITTDEDIAKNTITRVYDVRDLLVEQSDAAAPGKPQPNPTSTRSQRVANLMDLIRQTVFPDSWRDAGGNIGAIQELSGQLIVTQTPESHLQVQALLEQLRETHGVQIIIETRFLTINLKSLPENLHHQLEPALSEKGSFILDSKQAESVYRAMAAAPDSTLLTAPRLTTFNGQRAFITVGRDTPYISGYAAIKKPNGDTRFEPQTATITSGVTLDCTATAASDHKTITLQLHPRHSELLGMASEKWPGADGNDLRIQKPLLATQELATTVSVPDESVLVLAIGVSDQSTTRPAKSFGPDDRLFVLVKPTLIIQREVQANGAPIRASKVRD